MARRTVLLLLAAILILAAIATATRAADVSIERGRTIAAQWCSLCHAETQAQTQPDMEPPFAVLTERWSDNASGLRAFLDEDHFPMTTFRLFDDEKDAVTAYLMSLQTK